MNNIDKSGHGWRRADISYYHKDTLGSVVMLTGKRGHVEKRYDYDTYGNPYNGKFTQGNPYGFTGQRYETELRMYSFAYRTYNPVSMRWMTSDPVRDRMNWYQYCLSGSCKLCIS